VPWHAHGVRASALQAYAARERCILQRGKAAHQEPTSERTRHPNERFVAEQHTVRRGILQRRSVVFGRKADQQGGLQRRSVVLASAGCESSGRSGIARAPAE